jgi:TrmH family RNA methyltransferase
MGAIFRQTIRHMDISALCEVQGRGVRFVGTASGENTAGNVLDISEVDIKGAVVAIGSEGHGLSKEILSLCNELVTIPIAPQCESLNAAVAAGVIMWEGRVRNSEFGIRSSEFGK